MVVASFTDITKRYEVTVEKGKATNCSCPDHQYRNRTCKHLTNAQGQLDNPQPLYSEICGHLVRSNIYRHCGCMA